MSELENEDEERSVDLPLETYVSVHAAVGSGMPLEAALVVHGLDAETWLDADAEWAERLADSVDTDDGVLLDRYDEILLDLRRARPRVIPVLEDDLAAFLDFTRGLSGLGDAPAFLEERGISASDLAALHGRWAARLDQDPRAREEALEILAREPGPMPDVRMSPALALLPSAPAPANGAPGSNGVTLLHEPGAAGAPERKTRRA